MNEIIQTEEEGLVMAFIIAAIEGHELESIETLIKKPCVAITSKPKPSTSILIRG